MRFPWLFGACIRYHALLRQAFVAALAAACLGGCMSWNRSAERPADLLAHRPRLDLRVNLHDGRRMVIRHAFIRGDSLGGLEDLGGGRWQPTMVGLQDVVSTEISRLDVGRSAALAAAIGVTTILVVNGTRSSGGSSPAPTPPPNSGSGAGCGIMGCGPISCPLVYSWDGHHWRLDSGTFGGAIMAALQRTDLDNLDFATPQDATLRLRVTNEQAETDYLDALEVVAVDHDPSLAVAPDPSGRIHSLGRLVAPLAAADLRGADALPRVRDADGWNWESSLAGRDPARAADLRDGLTLTFVRPHGAGRAHLVLDGNSTEWGTHMLAELVRAHGRATAAWYDSMNAHPALAQGLQARLAREAFLSAAVLTPAGWSPQGTFWEAGPEVVKRQVLDLDLAGVTGDTVVVRLTTAPSFWTIDRVALDFTADRDLVTHALSPAAARDREGRDIRPLLDQVDHRYYVAQTGDTAEVTFSLPPLAPGLTRSFLLRSTGWYRIRTAEAGEPDVAALAALTRDSLGVGRASVLRVNAVLAVLARGER